MKKQDEIGFVIFGATGDLTRRKLLPALYQLASENRLPEKLKIIGFARRPWTDAELRQVLAEGIEEYARIKPVDSKKIETLLENAVYLQGEFEKPEGFQELFQLLDEIGIQKRIYYLATPPSI